MIPLPRLAITQLIEFLFTITQLIQPVMALECMIRLILKFIIILFQVHEIQADMEFMQQTVQIPMQFIQIKFLNFLTVF